MGPWPWSQDDHLAINTRQGNEQAGNSCTSEDIHPGHTEGKETEDPHLHLFY